MRSFQNLTLYNSIIISTPNSDPEVKLSEEEKKYIAKKIKDNIKNHYKSKDTVFIEFPYKKEMKIISDISLSNKILSPTSKEQRIENIFQPISKKGGNDKETPRRILVSGKLGSGKTILSQLITFLWGENGAWEDKFNFVFFIPLRKIIAQINNIKGDITVSKIILALCINQDPLNRITDHDSTIIDDLSLAETVKYIINQRPFQPSMLFVLDGYDEIADFDQEGNIVSELFKIAAGHSIILTTRHSLKKPSYISFDVEFENNDFNDRQISQYIKNYFPEFDPLKTEFFLEALKSNKAIYSLAHTPLILSLICGLYKTNIELINSSATLCNIFIPIIKMMLKKYLNDPDSNISNLNLKEKCLYEIETLGFVALDALQSCNDIDRISFDNPHVREANLNFKKQHPESNLFNAMVATGMLKPLSPAIHEHEKCQYEFLHPSFQEFFSAVYIIKCLLLEQHQERYKSSIEILKRHKYNTKFYQVFDFIFEILYQDDELFSINDLQNARLQFWKFICAPPFDVAETHQACFIINALDKSRCDSKIPNKDMLLAYVEKWLKALLYGTVNKIKNNVVNFDHIEAAFAECTDGTLCKIIERNLKNAIDGNIETIINVALSRHSLWNRICNDDLLKRLEKLKENSYIDKYFLIKVLAINYANSSFKNIKDQINADFFNGKSSLISEELFYCFFRNHHRVTFFEGLIDLSIDILKKSKEIASEIPLELSTLLLTSCTLASYYSSKNKVDIFNKLLELAKEYSNLRLDISRKLFNQLGIILLQIKSDQAISRLQELENNDARAIGQLTTSFAYDWANQEICDFIFPHFIDHVKNDPIEDWESYFFVIKYIEKNYYKAEKYEKINSIIDALKYRLANKKKYDLVFLMRCYCALEPNQTAFLRFLSEIKHKENSKLFVKNILNTILSDSDLAEPMLPLNFDAALEKEIKKLITKIKNKKNRFDFYNIFFEKFNFLRTINPINEKKLDDNKIKRLLRAWSNENVHNYSKLNILEKLIGSLEYLNDELAVDIIFSIVCLDDDRGLNVFKRTHLESYIIKHSDLFVRGAVHIIDKIDVMDSSHTVYFDLFDICLRSTNSLTQVHTDDHLTDIQILTDKLGEVSFIYYDALNGVHFNNDNHCTHRARLKLVFSLLQKYIKHGYRKSVNTWLEKYIESYSMESYDYYKLAQIFYFFCHEDFVDIALLSKLKEYSLKFLVKCSDLENYEYRVNRRPISNKEELKMRNTVSSYIEHFKVNQAIMLGELENIFKSVSNTIKSVFLQELLIQIHFFDASTTKKIIDFVVNNKDSLSKSDIIAIVKTYTWEKAKENLFTSDKIFLDWPELIFVFAIKHQQPLTIENICANNIDFSSINFEEIFSGVSLDSIYQTIFFDGGETEQQENFKSFSLTYHKFSMSIIPCFKYYYPIFPEAIHLADDFPATMLSSQTKSAFVNQTSSNSYQSSGMISAVNNVAAYNNSSIQISGISITAPATSSSSAEGSSFTNNNSSTAGILSLLDANSTINESDVKDQQIFHEQAQVNLIEAKHNFPDENSDKNNEESRGCNFLKHKCVIC